MTHPTEETLNDYVERELSPAEQVRVATHLETCARMRARRCRDSTDRARRGGARPDRAAASRVDVDSGAARQSTVGPSRQSTVQSPVDSPSSPESTVQIVDGRDLRGPRQRRRSSSWRFSPGGLCNQREQQTRVAADGSRRSPDARASNDATVRERVLLIAVGDHLERSQMVLVELAHAETRGRARYFCRAATRRRPRRV